MFFSPLGKFTPPPWPSTELDRHWPLTHDSWHRGRWESSPLTTRNTTRTETKIGAFVRRPYFLGGGGGMRYVALVLGKPFRKKNDFF